jgi:hypothetical protein
MMDRTGPRRAPTCCRRRRRRCHRSMLRR